jgi:hypothetical protein
MQMINIAWLRISAKISMNKIQNIQIRKHNAQGSD